MRRYLVWSTAFHALLLFVGAVIAPLRGLTGTYKPPIVIGVGLVDSGQLGRKGGGKPNLPKPAEDEIIAATPDEKSQLEKLKEKEKPKEPDKPKKNDRSTAKKDSTKTPAQLAQRDDTAGVAGTVTEGQGAGEGDVWGIEAGAGANPYHRAGFAAIRANWRNPAMGRTVRTCVVKFTVKRNGQLIDIEVDKPSGNDLFDRAAVRAIQVTGTWPAFPGNWEEDEQIIYLEFQYRP